jgi:hypothetical protein
MSEGGVINTPDQRLRVFVSSTLEELAAERRAVRGVLTSLRLVPVMFELGARPHPPREVYRAYLAQSQVFVGIYWQRYGWVAPREQVSGLEDEHLLPRLAESLARIRHQGDVSYHGRSLTGACGTRQGLADARYDPPRQDNPALGNGRAVS